MTGDHRFSALASGAFHTCGLTTGGAILCWGDDTFGQLGIGRDRSAAVASGAIGRSTPEPILGAKFFYYFIRPTQADPAITVVPGLTLPNHPSYPSGHSCLTSALMSVLISAFPSERPYLEEVITLAGMSRVYAGIHYRFDIEAGQGIGRQAAALALAGSLE